MRVERCERKTGRSTHRASPTGVAAQASGALAYSTVVCASAAAPPGMQCIAPFVGTAMAEHYRELGDDALVVYDDLSRHAEADRELGRLLHRPPGSFFTHGALIEVQPACLPPGRPRMS